MTTEENHMELFNDPNFDLEKYLFSNESLNLQELEKLKAEIETPILSIVKDHTQDLLDQQDLLFSLNDLLLNSESILLKAKENVDDVLNEMEEPLHQLDTYIASLENLSNYTDILKAFTRFVRLQRRHGMTQQLQQERNILIKQYPVLGVVLQSMNI
ncbi:hypothetical protein PCE1_000205 [Barthelona sp. PCE]